MTRAQLQSVVEALLVLGLIEAALWSEGRRRIDWGLAALAVVIAISLYRHDLWPRLGLGTRGLARSLWIVPAGVALSGSILLAGHLAGTLHGLHSPRVWYISAAGYVLWALQQQYLLQSFFYTRFESLLGDGWRAVAAAALLFAFCHIPNPVLMGTTFLMALAFCLLFRRYRNIYVLAIAHAMLGLALSAAVPEVVVRHMRVGIGYLHYIGR